MSLAGQVLCQRIVIGPWALTTDGAASAPPVAAANAAPRRNLRRDVSMVPCGVSIQPLLIEVWLGMLARPPFPMPPALGEPRPTSGTLPRPAAAVERPHCSASTALSDGQTWRPTAVLPGQRGMGRAAGKP